MNIKAMAKEAGVSEDQLKGKSTAAQIKIITKAMKEAAENIDTENAKEFIENAKKLSKITGVLDTAITIYAKNVGKSEKPKAVKLVGYFADESLFVVNDGVNFKKIKEADIIKTADEFKEANKKKSKK